MKKVLSLQIVLSFLFVFAINTYSADYDYGVFSACVNGCRGNAAVYSKLSKTEKENADRLIKTCVQACEDTMKGTKSPETQEAEPKQQEDNEKSQEQSESPHLVLNLGVGTAYPVDYAYPTGGVEYGNIGWSGFIFIGMNQGERIESGVEVVMSQLTTFKAQDTGLYDHGKIYVDVYTKNTAFYAPVKFILEENYGTFFKFAFGYAKTTLYADFKRNGFAYGKDSNSTKGISYYFAVGQERERSGLELRLTRSKYSDKDIGLSTNPYLQVSVMVFAKF